MFIENFIKKFLPGALLKPQKRINRLTILLRKWLGADCRAALYPLRTEHITLDSAYSDTAAVTSCSMRNQYT